MSVPKQKIVLINRTTPAQEKYFKIDQELYFLAASRLNKSGLLVYMYFIAQVPNTWDGIKNQSNKRAGAYEISTRHISEVINSDIKTATRGIEDLINNGYLKLLKGNLYQFIDILPEDKTQTIEEYEELQDYESMLTLSMNEMKAQRQNQLIDIAKKYKQDEQPIKFDWE